MGGRDGAAGARAQVADPRPLVAAVVLGAQLAPGVDLGADQVAVDLDAAGHDDEAGGVDDLGLVAVDLAGGDHAAVLDPDVRDLPVEAVARVVDPPSEDAEHHVLTASMRRPRISSSVGRPVSMT